MSDPQLLNTAINKHCLTEDTQCLTEDSVFLVSHVLVTCVSRTQIDTISEELYYFTNKRKPLKILCFQGFCVSLDCCKNYLFENWLALLAFLRPGFLRSFILGSLVRKPAALSAGL